MEIKNLFLGNLPYDASEESLTELVSPYGEVQSIKLVGDRQTGVFRGFAFVSVATADMQKLISELDNKPVGTQRLIVDEIPVRELETREAV